MVLEIAPDAREINQNIQSSLFEDMLGPNSAALENHRTIQRTCGENDLFFGCNEDRGVCGFTSLYVNSSCPLSLVKHDLVYPRTSYYLEIFPALDGIIVATSSIRTSDRSLINSTLWARSAICLIVSEAQGVTYSVPKYTVSPSTGALDLGLSSRLNKSLPLRS
jgi:hypothetical protein